MNWLGLYALLAFVLPVLWLLVYVVRMMRRRRRSPAHRASSGLSVAELRARLALERAAEADRTPRLGRSRTGLPRGFVWPDRDRDLDAAKTRPIVRRRLYSRPEYRRLRR